MSRATRTAAAVAILGVMLLSSAPSAQETTTPAPTPEQPAANEPPTEAKPIEGELSLTQRFTVKGESDGGQEGKATVGTPMVLTLEILHPTGTLVALPKEHPSGRFELLGVEREPITKGADPIREVIHMTFAVYRPGRHRLEPFEISVMDPEGRISMLKTQPVDVRVESVLADVKEIEMPPLRPPVSVWHEDWTLVGILSALGLVVLGVLLGTWLRRRWQPEQEEEGPPPRPAYDIAVEKLNAVQEDDLIGNEEFEHFYIRVSEAVREYLGRRYNLSLTDQAGLELTTAEIVGLLGDVSWPRGLSLFAVEQFLYDCDVVKFARYTPSGDECHDLIARAFALVESTRPITVVNTDVSTPTSASTAPNSTETPTSNVSDSSTQSFVPPAQDTASHDSAAIGPQASVEGDTSTPPSTETPPAPDAETEDAPDKGEVTDA